MSQRVTRSVTLHRQQRQQQQQQQQQQSTTTPEPSNPPADGTCRWWTVPPELRERVLRLAYGRDRDAPMKPIMGVDFLRDEIGFVTTTRRRGKLPKLPSTFEHYTSHFLVNKRWQTEALTAFFSSSDLDLTRRNRLLNFISSHASSSVFRIIDPLNTTTTTNLTLTPRNPLPGLLHLTSIRLLLSEILLPGVLESLSQTCPELSKLEIHAEARDFEGEDFEPSNLDPDERNISTTDFTLPISAKAADAAAFASLLSISPSTTPSTTRRNAPIWKLRHTVPSLHSTNFYSLIRDNLQGKLREATLMLSQKPPYWEGKTVGEESAFAWNLWKLRWVLLDCCVVVASGVSAGGGEEVGQRGWIEGETGEGMEVEETEIEKMEVEEGEIEEGEIEEEEIEEGEIEEMEVEEGEIVEIEGGEADRAVVGREAGINRGVRRSRRSRRMNAEIARL